MHSPYRISRQRTILPALCKYIFILTQHDNQEYIKQLSSITNVIEMNHIKQVILSSGGTAGLMYRGTSHFRCAAQRREEILGRFLRNRGGRWPDTDF